jgi:aspartyl-tRNA(Asn)/glutamyl-tRNA(Gln) amidotransferase subunit C
MDETIDRETFAHLVDLAALELDEQESEYLRGELNRQLKSIQQLAAIPLDNDVPVNLHGVEYAVEASPAMRKDEWAPFDNTTGILSQVPELSENYILVPDIPHSTLE